MTTLPAGDTKANSRARVVSRSTGISSCRGFKGIERFDDWISGDSIIIS